MPDMKYTKEDLMWEATRRNQDYKNDYDFILRKSSTKDNEYDDGIFIDTFCQVMDRWNIHISGSLERRIVMQKLKWLNPCIDINKIITMIDSEVNIWKFHPYHVKKNIMFLNESFIHFPRESIPYYHRTKKKNRQGIQGTIHEQESPYGIFICVSKKLVSDNILLLISPTSSDDSIMKAVQKIKKEVLKCIKEETDSLKRKGEKPYYPRDIYKYIGWLKKYDEIINKLIELMGSDNLTYKDGAVIIPEDFPFGDLVHRDTPGNKFAGQQKAYRNAYKGAVELIQTTPNIIVSPSRT